LAQTGAEYSWGEKEGKANRRATDWWGIDPGTDQRRAPNPDARCNRHFSNSAHRLSSTWSSGESGVCRGKRWERKEVTQVTNGPAVQLRDLKRVYQVGGAEVHAVKGITLEIQRGEFLAVVGVSGSGKSTLLHLVGGLDAPTDGEVLVEGRDIVAMSSYERSMYRRTSVGFVFQSFYLVPSLSAEANIRLALTFQGTFGTERNRRASDALERVGLAHRAKHRPGQLSAGEQQRVAVARAIVHCPPLLLADEPTGNLDHDTAAGLLELLCRIQRESEMTVVMVTHDEDLVTRYCGRKIRIRDGCLVDSGHRS